MSHVSTTETEFTDIAMLKKALTDLGHKIEIDANVKNKWIDEKVDLVIDIKGNKSIGFKKDATGTYNFHGDFYGLDKNSIVNPILQRYSANVIRQNYVRMGVRSITEQVTESGQIKIRGIVA